MKCCSTKCDGEATHKLFWTDGWHKYCLPCAMSMSNVGTAIGYPVAQTLQILTLDEMLDDDESDEVQS